MMLLGWYYFRAAAVFLATFFMVFGLLSLLGLENAFDIALIGFAVPNIMFLALMSWALGRSYWRVGRHWFRGRPFSCKRGERIVKATYRRSLVWIGPNWRKLFGVPA